MNEDALKVHNKSYCNENHFHRKKLRKISRSVKK